jgi:hypothetical protein
MTMATVDTAAIRSFLQAERVMREAVFRNNAVKRQTKVSECDRALRALEHVEAELSRLAELERQPDLFAPTPTTSRWEG